MYSCLAYLGVVTFTVAFAVRFIKAFDERQTLLQLILQFPEDKTQAIDLSAIESLEEADALVIDTFNSIRQGEAFLSSSNQDLKKQHSSIRVLLFLGSLVKKAMGLNLNHLKSY